MNRRSFLAAGTAIAAAPILPAPAHAQAYPTRPVRLVVGFAPGGSTDIAARLIGQWLSERMGQSFVIENRPGAATNIATEFVVKAAPDGYTLLMIAPSSTINATLYDGSKTADVATEVTFEDGRKGTLSARVAIRDAKTYPIAEKAMEKAA